MSHYKILGISRDASKVAIRAAYLQKAKKYHPDINQSPQADKLFKDVQEAYQVLTDESKRREFDGTTSSYSSATTTTTTTSDNGANMKFKGRVYDPEKEKNTFSREFYEQAEALRREMEQDTPASDLKSNLRRAGINTLWKLLPFVVIPSFLLLLYRRLALQWRKSEPEILHDMYGRAYKTDKFGRRVRSPRDDNKARISQWESSRHSDPSLALINKNDDTTNNNHNIEAPQIHFVGLDSIDATKTKLAAAEADGLNRLLGGSQTSNNSRPPKNSRPAFDGSRSMAEA